MKATVKLLVALVALSLVACSSDDTSSDNYDPNWGESLAVPSGKADFIDLAPTLEFDKVATGTVDNTELDLFKIALQNGDKIRVTKKVTSGDLKPDFTLFESFSTAVSSVNYDVGSGQLVKNYLVASTREHLIAVRPYRGEGAGGYSIVVECTGGPCAGEFFEPDTDEFLTVGDIDTCLWEARECAFSELPSRNGRVGAVTAKNIFNNCLESNGTADGYGCETACDAKIDGDTMRYLCDDIIESLPFYADQPTECHQVVADCMDNCSEANYGNSWGDNLWGTESGMCWSDGFNGTCQSYAQNMPECGGKVTNDTALCYMDCETTFGVWNDDLDTICSEDCGACGLECTRQIDWGWEPTVPSDGLVGDVVDQFAGEVDPFVVGDACITIIQVHQDGDGELAPGFYGLVDDLGYDCFADDSRSGAAYHVEMQALEEIVDQDTIDALESYDSNVKYFNLTDSNAPSRLSL